MELFKKKIGVNFPVSTSQLALEAIAARMLRLGHALGNDAGFPLYSPGSSKISNFTEAVELTLLLLLDIILDIWKVFVCLFVFGFSIGLHSNS